MAVALHGRGGSLNFFDRRNEPVSPPRQGFDIGRGLGRIPQRFADARDGVVQAVVEIHEGIGRPELVTEFLSRDQVAGGLQQDRQHLQRLALKAKLYATLPQFTSAQI